MTQNDHRGPVPDPNAGSMRPLIQLTLRAFSGMAMIMLVCLVILPPTRGGIVRPSVASLHQPSNGCSTDHWFRNAGHSGGLGDCSGGTDAGDGDVGNDGGEDVGNGDPPPTDGDQAPPGPGDCMCGMDCICDAQAPECVCESGSGESDDSGDTDGDGDVDDDDDQGDPPPYKRYSGSLWGGAASVYLNGIGTQSLWESNLIRPGDTAGPLAAAPEGTVVPASGYGIDDNTDLVVELPGRDFVLTRNFSGSSKLLRIGAFGPFALGGWTLSTDAYIYAELVPVSPPMKIVEGDNWKRMGVVVLVQSPIRNTVGFQNYLSYKPEAAWATGPNPENRLAPPGGPDYTETAEECRTFRPMGPGLARITADRLTFRTPFKRDYDPNAPPVTLPVWKVVEPGCGTSYFFRNCERDTTCVNLAKSVGGFDDYPYSSEALEKVPNGRLWCQVDEFGNVWTYEYEFKPVINGEVPRLAAIYLHGENDWNDGSENRKRARAVVRFSWQLMHDDNGDAIGSKIWHLKWVEVERPYRSSAENAVFKVVKPERVDYVYRGDLVRMLDSAIDTSALGSLHDDLVLVARRTGVHLPMSIDTREGLGDGELGHSSQITHYRYSFVPNQSNPAESSLQIKGVYGPAQIDAMVRDEWRIAGENGAKLWELGFELKPEWLDNALYHDATALALLTLNDLAMIEPTRGAGLGASALRVWQAANRWTTFHGHTRTVPPSGDGSTGSSAPSYLGRLREEYAHPGIGGPTLRREFAYGTDEDDLRDATLINRKCRIWAGDSTVPFDLRHSYRLRGSVQQVREWTRTTDEGAPEGDLWNDPTWTLRRRITTRSEERELFAFNYQYSQADGTPLGLKSLVSAVPFTVAELVEELDAGTGERRRSWLTIHEYDNKNRPSRTLDPGAFTEEYPSELDSPLADTIKLRLVNWRDFVAGLVDATRHGAIQSTTYQDAVSPTPAFVAQFAAIEAAGGTTRFDMNYPGTLRAQRKLAGNTDDGLLVEFQVHPGELKYFGSFKQAGVSFRRPDLLDGLHRSRTGANVLPSEVEQFESVTLSYSLEERLPAMAYPAVTKVISSVERELESENGPPESGAVSTTYYLDSLGRERFRIGPDGVAVAFEYGLHGPDLTGRPERVYQNVTLSDASSDADDEPDGFESVPWDDGVGTLYVSALRDVSGNLLTFVNADGVSSARCYEIRRYVDPFDEAAAPIPTVAAVTLPPLASVSERAGPIAVSFVDTAGRTFRTGTFAPVVIEANADGVVTTWQSGQEFTRSFTGFYLSGATEREVSYSFASLGGVFPASVPGELGGRSRPVVSFRAFDGDDNLTWSMDAPGNTERIEYDARSRPIRVYRGIDGIPDQLVEARFYDGEGAEHLGVGDGLLTRIELYADASATAAGTRVVRNWYDPRDHVTLAGQFDASGNAVAPYELSIFDNLDRAVLSARLSAAVNAPEGYRFVASEAEIIDDSSAISIRRTLRSQRGKTYREEVLLERAEQSLWQRSDHWLDVAGREIASSGDRSVTSRQVFDPHGRVTHQWTSAGTPTSFVDAADPSKGFVLDETLTTYLPARTLPGLVTRRQRTHTTVPSSGTLSDDPIGLDPLKGVTTYSATAYDQAGRPVAAINYGTSADPSIEGFTSIGVTAAPALIPFGQNTSTNAPLPTVANSNAIVTRTGYDVRGQANVVSRWLETGPAGQPTKQEATRTLTDSLGRVYATIENDSNPAGSSPVSIAWTAQGGGRWSASGMGQPTSDQNRVTTKVYDTGGNVIKHVAHQRTPSGAQAVQVTAFRYQWDQAIDGASSLLPSNRVLYEIRYPATSGAAIGEASENPIDRVHYSYNALGEQIAVQDQNGTIRDFVRDSAGRMIADRVRAFGATSMSTGDSHANATVDRAVSQIITNHDEFGRVAGVISCLRPTGEEYDPALNLDPTLPLSTLLGSDLVHNFVTYQYDDLLGLVTSFRQSSEGKLPPQGAGPNYREVGLAYERVTGAAGAAWRVAKAKHPDATFADPSDDAELIFNYTGHPVDDAINRAWGLSLSTNASAQELVRYARQGTSTFAVTDFRQIGVQLDRTVAADGSRDYDPSGGPIEHSRYGGWDRYGRLLRSSWVRSEFGAGGRKPLWQELYAHDALSRRTKRDETRGNYNYPDEDWRVTYDGLDRVVKTERGRTDATGLLVTPSTGLPVKQWTLDELGNWTGVLSSRPGSAVPPLLEARQHNASNEIQSIGVLTRTYDANGNLRLVRPSGSPSLPDRQRYVVDAWNRVVRVEWLRTPVPTPMFDTLEYSYNGLNHLVLEKRTPASGGAPTKVHRFYSPTWQLLLERHETFDGTAWQPGAIEQQFFGLRGLDDAILRRIDANGDGDCGDAVDLSYHQLTDASFSVVAHVDFSSGLVRQWMSYDAFGVMKVLRPGDFDGSGVVNGDDWTAFNDAFVDPALALLSCDIDFDGTVTGSDYDLFGQLWEECLATHPDEVRLGYAGYARDPTTGLLLARHRWYDASVGRWITRDPAGYVDGLSLYLYARGNPFGLVDPMGLGGEESDKKENERTAAYQYKHRNSEYHQYGSDYEGGNDDEHGFSDAVDRKRGEIHRHLYNDGDFEGTIVFPMYDDAAALNADQVVAHRDFFRTAGNIGTTLRMAGEAATAFNPITNAAMTVSNFAEDPSFSNAVGVALAALPAAGKVVQGAGKESRALAKAAEDAAGVGRAGKQARLRELAEDVNLSSADRGWIRQELISIDRGNRGTIRVPPGKVLAHERGREAAKGFSYEHSNLQEKGLHQTQHKLDDFGRRNKARPERPDE